MSKNIHQCNQCKKEFAEQELYRIGIKQKDFFCRECAKNIKSECMWCGKELVEKEWKRLGGSSGIKAEEGKLVDTIDRDDHRKEKHQTYYLCCEETREHGMRPNQSCPSRINDWWVKKTNQRYQDRKNQGWKECAGKGVYYKDPKTGKVVFDLDCYKLVPLGQKYCGDDSCIYYTAVYNGTVSEKEKRIKAKWNQRTQEKYQRANEWWNSLSLAEKQAKLKAEKEHLNSLGLQRQRCWIEKIDQNSILFENGELYYDNMDKIPPSFLHEFGLPGYQWENVWKRDENRANTLQTVELAKEISKKVSLLEHSKETGDNELAAKLEQQIQELKNQQKEKVNSNYENPAQNKVVVYSAVGFTALSVVGLIFMIKKTKTRKPKIKL